MNLMPQITIIVPVYNAERTLERCVRSIQAQTVVNWELLLIDDGSEDYSSKLCDEYAIQDSRIRVFHQVNGERVLQETWDWNIQKVNGSYFVIPMIGLIATGWNYLKIKLIMARN